MLIETYAFQPAKILRIVRESPRAVSVEIQRPKDYVFLPGQHAIVRVTLRGGIRLVRQYSFSSTPNTENLWFTIIQQDTGEVSTWFNSVATAHDTIEITAPFTGQLVQKTPRGKICMIAGGSGVVPLMSHLRSLRTSNTPYSVTLLYSTRQAERCYTDELLPAGLHEKIIVRITDKESRFNATEVLRELHPGMHVFICGSRSFITAMRTACKKVIDPTHIHAEAFTL